MKQQNPGQTGRGITMIFKPILPDFTNQRPGKKKKSAPCQDFWDSFMHAYTLGTDVITLL